MAEIRTENLTYTYSAGTPFEHTAISGVNFTATEGEVVGIIGHTGSGKSTFIQHLNGLLKPLTGNVFLDGIDIFEKKEKLRSVRFEVGLVFQYPEYQLFEETVYKDIAFGPNNMGLSEREIDERVLESADFVGISAKLLEKSPFELSGGEKRRAAIAGVIAMRPKILILDEPTAGLDPRGRDEIMGHIRKYRESTGSTIIMVTHSMDDIAREADRIVVFSKGKIVLEGTPAGIFSRGSELTALGLAAPVPVKVAELLRERGIDLNNDIFTSEQMKNELIRYVRRAGQ